MCRLFLANFIKKSNRSRGSTKNQKSCITKKNCIVLCREDSVLAISRLATLYILRPKESRLLLRNIVIILSVLRQPDGRTRAFDASQFGRMSSFQFQLPCRNPSSARNVSPTRRTAVMQTRAGALRNAPETVRRLTMMNAICRALLLYPMQVE